MQTVLVRIQPPQPLTSPSKSESLPVRNGTVSTYGTAPYLMRIELKPNTCTFCPINQLAASKWLSYCQFGNRPALEFGAELSDYAGTNARGISCSQANSNLTNAIRIQIRTLLRFVLA